MPSDSPLLPEFVSWPTFPFEGDLRVRKVDPAVPEEPPRPGEDPATCTACQTSDSGYLWVSARWRVRSPDRPTGLPVVLILESRSHLDLGDLPNLLAAELGVMTVRLERAIRSLEGVARVHVNRWGDGSAHLHLWFLARPLGQLQLRGTFLSLWDDILPPVPEVQWRENLALVGAWLSEFGGRSNAEPPRIDWKAPSSVEGLPAQVTEGRQSNPDRAAPDMAAWHGGSSSADDSTRSAENHLLQNESGQPETAPAGGDEDPEGQTCGGLAPMATPPIDEARIARVLQLDPSDMEPRSDDAIPDDAISDYAIVGDAVVDGDRSMPLKPDPDPDPEPELGHSVPGRPPRSPRTTPRQKRS